MRNLSFLSIISFVYIVCNIGCARKEIPAPTPASDMPAYQEYAVIYNQALHTTRAMVHMYLGSSRGQYMSMNDSTVLANGQKTKEFNIWEFDSLVDVNFVFNRKGILFLNAAAQADIEDINFSSNTPTEIALKGTTIFSWDGPPLSPDETADIMFESTVKNASFSFGLAANDISLAPHQLYPMVPGVYKMKLTRRKVMPLDQEDGNAGGKIIVKKEVERSVLLK